MLLVATGDELAGALRYGTLLLLSNHFLGGYNPIFWPDHMLSIISLLLIYDGHYHQKKLKSSISAFSEVGFNFLKKVEMLNFNF